MGAGIRDHHNDSSLVEEIGAQLRPLAPVGLLVDNHRVHKGYDIIDLHGHDVMVPWVLVPPQRYNAAPGMAGVGEGVGFGVSRVSSIPVRMT
jgi:hypothetical protein